MALRKAFVGVDGRARVDVSESDTKTSQAPSFGVSSSCYDEVANTF